MFNHTWPKRLAGGALAAGLVLALLQVIGTGTASATPSDTAEITIANDGSASQLSGAAVAYTIAVSCSGTNDGTPCGGASNSTITIPLDGTNSPAIPMTSWTFAATSDGGLIVGSPAVSSNNVVLTLSNSVFVAGYSGTITFDVTAPDNTTPDDTTWTLTPTVAGGNITSVTASPSANGEATAGPLPVITKFTDDGGSVYAAGSNVTYDITANCNTGATGNLYLTSGSLTDPLPAGMTFVSSSPAGGSYDLTSNAVTWTFANGAATPAGSGTQCASGSSGATSYQIVATAPTPAPALGSQPLVNEATFGGEAPIANGGSVSASTDAQANIYVVDTPPTSTGQGPGYPTITKSSLAPLADNGLSGNQYEGTYAGDWVTPSGTPTYTVGAASGSFQVDVGLPMTHTYQTQIVDPLPCISDNNSGGAGAQVFYSDSSTVCSDPAFHSQVIEVTGFGTGQAVANGWAPTATLADTSTVTLTPTSTVALGATAAYYDIPGGDITSVANINVPTTPYLTGNATTLTVWGYADQTLVASDSMQNTATVTPYLDNIALTPETASANLYIFNPDVQLGISKSFGPTGKGPGGTTVLNIEGAVNFPVALSNSVVMTDLLPSGLSWSNQAATGQFTLSEGSGEASTTVTATISYTTDYEGTERDLIQAEIPSTDFASTGTYTITPPADFFEMTTPTSQGTYSNTDQIFLYDYPPPAHIDPTCTTPTQTTGGTTPATLESYNPLNLAGDGETQEDYCQNGASLNVEPSGAAFNLIKTVLGNLDGTDVKGALGIGDASGGGTGWGIYGLTWTNDGSDTLDDPVIYDILPYIGDTGVSQAQSGVQRGSLFQPTFDSIVGTLPSGVEVLYSTSENPCRAQVYASAPGCVSNWTTVEPSPPSSVHSLEFIDTTNQYVTGASFSVSFKVDVPIGDVNEIAWNSAATNATDVSNPSTVPLPAEPPKVGLVAPSGGVSMTTQSSQSSLDPYSGTNINDTVSIFGTNGYSGTLDWSFVGVPMTGSCASINWSSATTYAQGSITTPASDGEVTVGPAQVGAEGCYSWVESLTLDQGQGSTSLAAGSESTEIVQAVPYTTTVSSTATPLYSTGSGLNTSSDSITVSGAGLNLSNSNGSGPTSNTLTWDLYFQATPATPGTCAGTTWSGSPLASGTIDVTANGTYGTGNTTLTQSGCYTYTTSLPSLSTSTGGATAEGVTSETFILVPPPTFTTDAQQATPNPRTAVTDKVMLVDTYGLSGTVSWDLYGPVAEPGGGCTLVGNWGTPTVISGGNPSGTATAITANVSFSGLSGGGTGNGTVTVPSSSVDIGPDGCYSWAETVYGPNFVGPNPVAPGGSNEVFLVSPYTPIINSTTPEPLYNGTNNTSSDTVDILDGDFGGSHDAPDGTLTWTLWYNAQDGDCSTVSSWTQVATGTASVTEGSNTGIGEQSLSADGCYTYTDSVAANSDSNAIAITAESLETFEVLSTQVITTQATPAGPVGPRTTVSDSVTITGTDNNTGTLNWQLLGPVTPIAGSCSGVNWGLAPTYRSNQVPITHDITDQTVPAGGLTVGAPGCYGWAEQLTGNNFFGITSSPAATASETFLVLTLTPSISSTIEPSVSGGVESAYDSVVVGGTDIQPGNLTGAPTSGTVNWDLYGPVTTPLGGCAAVSSWGTNIAASGTITLTGNATNTTPTKANLALDSCYSYAETLAATTDTYPEDVLTGTASEMVSVPPAAQMSTSANQTSPAPRTSVSDSVTIAGTNGGTGTLTWSLVEALTVPVSGGCGAANWSSTTTIATNTVAITGDQSDLTVPNGGVTLKGPGCYSWADTLQGNTFPGSTIVAAGAAGEYFQVQPLQPTLVTTIVPTVAGGNETVHDSIVVSGTDIAPINSIGAPTSGTLDWALYGPVAPVNGSCSTVSWSGLIPVGSGSVPVTGNGTYPTPESADLSLDNCYSYSETLLATTDSSAASVVVGTVAETAEVPPPPTVTSETSAAISSPGLSVSDNVTITGMGSYSGTLTWTLVGPVTPAQAGSCTGVIWANAPATPVAAGTLPVAADGTVATGPVLLSVLGCYGWTDSISGTFPGSTSVGAGATGEIVLVENTAYTPLISTDAVVTSGPNGTKSITDSITLARTGVGYGTYPVTETSMSWDLLGPIPAVSAGCSGVTWTGAAVAATGTITVTGDASYSTPPEDLTDPGCYTYSEQLSPTANSVAASSLPGGGAETALLLAPPSLASDSSVASAKPHSSISDTVSVTDSGGGAGVLSWSLVGPVAPAAGGTCDGVTWADAPSVTTGSVAVDGDGQLTTGPAALRGTGCYSWVDSVSGDPWVGQTSMAAGAAHEVVVVEPYEPVLMTAAGLSGHQVSDAVTLSGWAASSAGSGQVAIDWALLGPVAAPTAAGCSSVSWSGRALRASGTIAASGDGTYSTATTTLSAPGCYTYTEKMAATGTTVAVSTQAGSAAETVYMSLAPSVTATTTTSTTTTTTTTARPTTSTTTARRTTTTRPRAPTTTAPAEVRTTTTRPARPSTTTSLAVTTTVPPVPTTHPKPAGKPAHHHHHGSPTTTTAPTPVTTAAKKSGSGGGAGNGGATTTTTTLAPNGLGAIGTDLGRWSPPDRAPTALVVGLAFVGLGTAAAAFGLLRRRQRRRTWRHLQR